MRLLVVGGSDAGTMAALRARELDPGSEVTMLVADGFPNFSVCGLPFFVSREVSELTALAHRTAADIVATGVDLLLDHEATRLDPEKRVVFVRGRDGRDRELPYDVVVIATGARPRMDGIRGADLQGVYPLHTIADGLRVRARIDGGTIERAVLVGAGYIGLEMADALTRRGIAVTVISRPPAVMPRIDPTLAELVRVELERNAVEVIVGASVEEITRDGETLRVRTSRGASVVGDLVLIGGGVEPNTELARAAGVVTGVRGAIRVDRRMRTNLPGVLAAGDCVETRHRLLEKPTYLPLGTTAHKQGRIAGESALGGKREFQGSVGTQVVKVFELAVAATGLRDDEARENGFDPLTFESTPWDHKVYYPGAHRLRIRVTGDRRTGQLLGGQIVGHWQAEVAKRIDIFATALFHGMTVDGIGDLDLSYTPPLGAPWDAVQEAALAWVNSLGRQTQRVTAERR